MVTIGPATIDPLGVDFSLLWGFQRKLFYAAGRHWAFYVGTAIIDGVQFVYNSSLDGETWGAPTFIRAAQAQDEISVCLEEFSENGDPSAFYVHYAFGDWDTGNLYYRRGELNADGTVSWSAEQIALAAGAGVYYFPTICIDENTAPYIGYVDTADWLPHVIASDTAPIWTMRDGFPYEVYAAPADWICIVTPLGPKIHVTITRPWDNILYDVYDVDTDIWTGTIPSLSWIGDPTRISVTSHGEVASAGLEPTAHVVYQDAMNDLWHTAFDMTNGPSIDHLIFPGPDDAYPTISIKRYGSPLSTEIPDPPRTLFVFWTVPFLNFIVYKKSVDYGITWSDEWFGPMPEWWIEETEGPLLIPLVTSYFEEGREYDDQDAGFIGTSWGLLAPSPDIIRYGALEFADPDEDLPGEFIIQHADAEDLPGEFVVQHVDLTIDLPAEFIVQHVVDTADLPGEFIVQHEDSEDLPAGFDGQVSLNLPAGFDGQVSLDLPAGFDGQVSLNLPAGFDGQVSLDLPAGFDGQVSLDLPAGFDGQVSLDLPAGFDGQVSLNLPAEFIVQHESSQDLLGKFITQHAASELLPAHFDAQVSLNLPAEFEVGQGSEDLPAGFILRQGIENLPAEMIVQNQGDADLKAGFDGQVSLNLPAGFDGQVSLDLPAGFDGQVSLNLPAGFDGQVSLNLNSKFIVQHVGDVDLDGKFIVQRDGDVDLDGKFIVQHDGDVDLDGKFIVQHVGDADLDAEFIVRHDGEADLPAEFIVRHEDSQDLPAGFRLRQDVEDLPAEIIVRHSGSVDLPLGFFIVRHDDDEDLLAGFVIDRSDYIPQHITYNEYLLRTAIIRVEVV